MTARVLLVEDSPTQLAHTQLALQSQGFEVDPARDGREAWTLALSSPPDVILADVLMPHLDGFQLCRLVRSDPTLRDVPFILMTTTFRGDEDRALAMDTGADDFIDKAVGADTLGAIIAHAIARRQDEGVASARGARLAAHTFSAHHIERLQERLLDKATELEQAYEALSRAYDETLEALVAALDLRAAARGEHSWRLGEYAVALGRRLRLDDQELTALYRGALLHDIGTLAVPDRILGKEGPLDDDEWGQVRLHPELGHDALAHVEFLAGATALVLAHHERWDGAGYPRGLAGDEIPLGARVFAVADALDAMTSERPYRQARSMPDALAELARNRGAQFDPQVVDAALATDAAEWERLRELAGDRRAQRRVRRPAEQAFWTNAGHLRVSRTL